MKGALTAILLSLPIPALSQNPSGQCPPGWEKNPAKHPLCLGYVLPVTVKKFEAKVIAETVVLKWETGTEVNHSHYIIQRSKDAKTFTDLGQTTGHRFTDYLPERESYYRLVSVDIDNTRHNYSIIFTAFKAPGYTIYTAEGKHLGEFERLQEAPKNTVLIINQTKKIIKN